MSQQGWPEEGRRSEHGDRAGQRPIDDWAGQAPPPPSGMSGGMKACLVLICVLGFCCLLCCGIFGYMVYSVVPKISNKPADVDAARDEIAKINLPPGFQPKNMGKSDNFLFSMIWVLYENPGHARLMVGQFGSKLGGANDMQRGMRQQFEVQRDVEFQPMANEKSETRTLKIKGRDCNFVIASGQEVDMRRPVPGNNKPAKKVEHHRISGEFDGKGGMAVIVIDFDDTYKEADIIRMLENIQ
jgi:hypothetical protein